MSGSKSDSLFDKFNRLSLPVKKYRDLVENETYRIVHIETIQTQYDSADNEEKTALLTLEKNDQKFKLFLPKRFSNLLNDPELKNNINDNKLKCGIKYKGENELKNQKKAVAYELVEL